MMRWYVVHTHSRKERLAYEHLSRQGFKAYLPEYRRSRRHARRIDVVRAPLFPRYLFVEMDLAQTRWRLISNTIGVSHIVSNCEMPAPVPVGIVEEIRAHSDENGLVSVKPVVTFSKGETVKITNGTLAEQIGLFDSVTDDDRVVLLLNMLGRRVKITLPLASVAAYA